MKRAIAGPVLAVLLAALPLGAQTNDLFDDTPAVPLNHPEAVLVGGEVGRETSVVLASLPLRSVAAKEAVRGDDGRVVFLGAYRYDGYSLADILDRITVEKKNSGEYSRIIDVYVEVANEAGEKAVFSWGEIYYPADRHRIILATAVSRLVPSLTKDLWPLPSESKLVAGSDLLSIRNISRPSRITIRSLDMGMSGIADGKGEASSKTKLRLCLNGVLIGELSRLPEKSAAYEYPAVFYGRGKGFLGIETFRGVALREVLSGKYPAADRAMREGLVAVIASDGYRAAFSLAEIADRNDFREILLMDKENNSGESGGFALFPAGDFFSDRAVKGIRTIDLRVPLHD